MNLFKELKRRNVFRIAGIYAVVAWILMQVAGTLEASLKLPEWFDSVVTAGLMIGFPIALLLAWAFEMTPNGVKRTSDGTDEQLVSTSKIDGLILLGIIIVIGLGIWQQMNPKQQDSGDITDSKNNNSVIPVKTGIQKPKETIQPNSIAVLPFTDLSPNKDQEYFSDGMAEEILNVLVRVDALKVTSRTSAFQFKGQEIGIPEIASQLKVRHIVEGSVRKSGNNLRITAQLIVAKDDKHLWSKTYDRPLSTDNIFAIQDEISNAIVKALKDKLGLKNIEKLAIKQNTQNLSAYELYLQARPLFIGRKQLAKADGFLIKAIELDSKFAQAWAMRAAINSLNLYYEIYDTTTEQDQINSLDYANRSLLLDPNNALALSVRAFTKINANSRLRGQFDYFDIINDLKKSLHIEPKNSTTLLWLSAVYWKLGYIEKSARLLKQCIEYEPSYVPCISNYIGRHEYLGNYQKASDLYLNNLAYGLLDVQNAPLLAIAHSSNKLAFMLILNSPNYFKGWNRNEEIYNAYRNPSIDHSLLIKEAIDWISNKQIKPISWEAILIPIGYKPQQEKMQGYDVFTFNTLKVDSENAKKHIKGIGVFSYWQKHGYPPQCRPIGEDDFECD